MHSDSATTKLDHNIQNIARTVVQRDGTLLCLEEAGIRDASNINLDQLVDIKELGIIEGDNASVIINNVLIISFSNKLFFSVKPPSQG